MTDHGTLRPGTATHVGTATTGPLSGSPSGSLSGSVLVGAVLRPSTTVIRNDGVLGIFRPVDSVEDDSDRKLVEDLAAEVARLQKENDALRAQVASLQGEGRHYDELGTAIANATDQLQRQLSESSNGVTRFALREVQLDTRVSLDLDELGNLRYRFPTPGAPEDASVGRLAMTIVPIPVENAEAASLLRPSVPLETLPSVDAAGRKALAAAGLFRAGDLVSVGSRARVATELQRRLGVDRATLRTWVSEAELVTLPGATGRHVTVLRAAGFDSLAAVGAASVEDLVARFDEAAGSVPGATPLDPELAGQWVAAAAASRRG
jgi:hypothetical protein